MTARRKAPPPPPPGPPTTTPDYSLHLDDASLAEMLAVQGLVERFCAQTGVPPADASEIRRAVEEAFSNIVRHGYKNLGGYLDITMTNEDGLVTITFVDKAPLFDPAEAAPDARAAPTGIVRPGVGWRGVARAVDELLHRPGPRRKGNVVTLIKKVEQHPPRPHLRLER